jgi:hypothetical protein
MSVTYGAISNTLLCLLQLLRFVCVCVCVCVGGRGGKGAIYIGLWIPQTLSNVGILGQSAQDYVLEINTLLCIALKENML